MTRGPHRDGDGTAVDPQLERLLDGHDVRLGAAPKARDLDARRPPPGRAEIGGGVHVREQLLRQLDPGRTELVDRVTQAKLTRVQPALQHGKRHPRVASGERPALRHGGGAPDAGVNEQVDRGSGQRDAIDRKDDGELRRRRAKPRDEPRQRRADVGAVVDQLERQCEPVRMLADGEPVRTSLAEQPPRALGHRLAAAHRNKCLRRAEARARAADEQDPGDLHETTMPVARAAARP